jgi:hypothetical protein
MAPKKSMATTCARHLRNRATCVLRATLGDRFGLCIGAQRLRHGARRLGHVFVIGIARLVEKRPDLLVGKAIDQARLADNRFAVSPRPRRDPEAAARS